MSQRDDGAPERPTSTDKPAAPPRPRTSGRANPPPPPLPTAANEAPPPPRQASSSVEADRSDGVDEGWLAAEDAAEEPLAPPAPERTPPPPSPITPPPASNPFLPPPPPSPVASPPPTPIAETAAIAEVDRTEQTPVAPGDAEPAKPRSARASEPTPSSSPLRKRSRAKVLAFVLLPALVLVGGGFLYQARTNARSPKIERAAPQSSAEATGHVEPPPSLTTEPPPPPTHTPESPPSASARKKPGAGAGGAGAADAVSADPSKTGIVDTTSLPAGRKIVVDGRVVGTSPRKVAVRCGVHRFQIGDLPPETLELPCGGEISFSE